MRTPPRVFAFLVPTLFTFAALVGWATALQGQNTAELDTRWWVTDAHVFSVVRDGSTVYLGGSFEVVGPSIGFGTSVRLDTGAPDPTYAQPNARVFAVAPAADGGWFIGGDFTQVGGQPRSRIARLNADGSLHPWNADVSARVEAIAVHEGVVYVGGFFTTVNGEPRSRIAALDEATGALTGWNPSATGLVLALVVRDGIVYAGGTFRDLGGQPRNRLGGVEVTTGLVTPWNPDLNDEVNALVLTDDLVYAAGRFTTVGGVTRNRIAAIDRGTGAATSWNPNSDNRVEALAISDEVIYAGGNFRTIGGQNRSSFAALSLETGNATSWNPDANGLGRSILVHEGIVYVGGFFRRIAGQQRMRLAAFDESTGALTAWNPTAGNVIDALSINDAGVLYAGGNFTTIGGTARERLAALDANTGEATAWNPGSNGTVRALLIHDGVLYAGGSFSTLGGQSRSNLAAIDISTGVPTAWNPGANAAVRTVAVRDNLIYAGGNFTTVGGQPRSRLAAIDATTGAVTSWDPAANGRVDSFVFSEDVAFVGGDFTLLGSTPRLRIGAVDPVTGEATDWDPGADREVQALAVQGYTLFAGGDFRSIGGASRDRLAALDTRTGEPLPLNASLNGRVVTLALRDGYLYLGGEFETIDGTSRPKVASMNASTGQVTPWNPGASGSVDHLLVTEDPVFAVGNFGQIGDGVSRSHLAVFRDNTPPAPPAPTQFALATPPSAVARSGVAFSQQPALQLQDAQGAPVSQAGWPVTASVASGGGTVLGTATAVTDANGVATFTDLAVEGLVGERTLDFRAPGLDWVTSEAFALEAGLPATLAISTGAVQDGRAGMPVSTLPAVRVDDGAGNPVAGVDVLFEIASGEGTVDPALAVPTGTDGIASPNQWTLGLEAGIQTLTATVEGLPAVTFTAGAGTALKAPTLTEVTAEYQQVRVAFTPPDLDGGDPLLNYEYSVDNGAHWVAFEPAVTTSPVLITGLTNNVSYPIRLRAVDAEGPGLASEPLHATPEDIIVVIEELDRRVFLDDFGPGLGEVRRLIQNTVTFPDGPGAFRGPGFRASFGQGDDVVIRIEPESGSSFAVYQHPDATSQVFALSTVWQAGGGVTSNFPTPTIVFENLEGVAPEITFEQAGLADNGNELFAGFQSTVLGDFSFTAIEISFTVGHVLDRVDRPFGPLSSGSAPSFGVTAIGPEDLEERVLFALVGEPAQLAILPAEDPLPSGTSQDVVVTVEDARGNRAFGDNNRTVTLAAIDGTGTVLGLGTAVTEDGVATFSLTGQTAGAVTLEASATGLASSMTTVNVVAGPASQIEIFEGADQTALAGRGVVTLPSVLVRDANDNGVPGVSVLFLVTSGGGSVTGGSAVTDEDGIAAVVAWTLGATAGTNTLTATAEGLEDAPVVFTATGRIDPDLTEALAAAEAEAQNLIDGDYTPETWAALQAALAKPATTDAEVEAKVAAIEAALEALVFAGNPDPSLRPGPGEAVGVVDGESEALEVDVIEGRVVQLTGESLVLSLDGVDESGEPIGVAGPSTLLRLDADGILRLAGGSYTPGSSVSVWILSDPTFVGRVVADEAGVIQGEFAVPAALPLGLHTLQIVGLDPEGDRRTVALPVWIDGAEDLRISVESSNATPQIGETITFTVNVTNAGPRASLDVEVETGLDDLRLRVLEAFAPRGAFDSATGVWRLGLLEVGETVTLTLTAEVLLPEDGASVRFLQPLFLPFGEENR